MKRLLPLLLLCLGCAAGDAYERGAYRPPGRAPVRTPTTNPTTDAPMYAPPGHAPQPGVYPRSPHSRVLPPTWEPGVWASSEPDAAPSIHVLGVPLASPRAPEQRSKTAWCAAQAGIAFNSAKYAKRDVPWLKCFANVLVQGCLDAEIRNMETRRDTNTAAPYHLERLKDLRPAAEFAARQVMSNCPSFDPETTQAYNDMWAFVSKLNMAGGK